MIEVEKKYRLPADAQGVVERIRELCSLSKAVRQTDLVYLNGISSFRDFTPGDPVLRCRSVDDDVTFTVKRKIPEGGVWEVELPVNDVGVDRVEDFMCCLGWNLVARIIKTRRTAQADDITIVVDDVEGLGQFVELEVLVAATEEVNRVLRDISQLCAKLGILKDWEEPRKYDELLIA